MNQRDPRFPDSAKSLTLLAFSLLALSLLASSAFPGTAAERTAEARQPAYDAEGRLLLPQGFEQWILAGSSLGLSYTEDAMGHEMLREGED